MGKQQREEAGWGAVGGSGEQRGFALFGLAERAHGLPVWAIERIGDELVKLLPAASLADRLDDHVSGQSDRQFILRDVYLHLSLFIICTTELLLYMFWRLSSSCPRDACGFVRSAAALLDHFAAAHNWSWSCTTNRDDFTFLRVYHHRRGSATFSDHLITLNVTRGPLGRIISVLCIQRRVAEQSAMQCEVLFVSRFGYNGSCSSPQAATAHRRPRAKERG
uniref:Uncharacterized protein n=1 Tax=Oryza brachyantha TaxID=4533 RepID=J3LZY1_ORYBR